jgi:hypothetical protein
LEVSEIVSSAASLHTTSAYAVALHHDHGIFKIFFSHWEMHQQYHFFLGLVVGIMSVSHFTGSGNLMIML